MNFEGVGGFLGGYQGARIDRADRSPASHTISTGALFLFARSLLMGIVGPEPDTRPQEARREGSSSLAHIFVSKAHKI